MGLQQSRSIRYYASKEKEWWRNVALVSIILYYSLAISRPIFTADMTTYNCHTLEEALKRAKMAGKRPGYWYGGIVLKSGKKGFAIYREGKVIEQYSVIGR